MKSYGTSLLAQWLRIHLPMQGTQVQYLVREDPTRCGATKPMHHNYWACALKQGSPTPGTGPQPVRNWATQQEVSSGWVSEASSAAPHRLYYHLNHPPPPVEKSSSMKPVPGAKKVGDLCSRAHEPQLPTKPTRYNYRAHTLQLLKSARSRARVATTTEPACCNYWSLCA